MTARRLPMSDVPTAVRDRCSSARGRTWRPPALSRVLSAALAAVAFPASLAGQAAAVAAPARDLAAFADSAVPAILAELPAAGAAVTVVRGPDTLVHDAWGFADLELEVAARPDHVFRIGSVTKQFTAAAIMREVE
ncbi:MAG: serine hydrolase domain-containing protein, partial [Gemmatimonadota bacterium]